MIIWLLFSFISFAKSICLRKQSLPVASNLSSTEWITPSEMSSNFTPLSILTRVYFGFPLILNHTHRHRYTHTHTCAHPFFLIPVHNIWIEVKAMLNNQIQQRMKSLLGCCRSTFVPSTRHKQADLLQSNPYFQDSLS